MASRKGLWGLVAALAFVSGVIVACGGGSSSTTGPSAGRGGGFSGGSGAVVQGQIVRSQSAALHESTVVVVLRTALGIGLAEAAVGDPVVGATVNLKNGAVIAATTTTDSAGNFQFTGVPPGTYTIEVIIPPAIVATPQDVSSTASITVGTGDIGTVVGTVKVATDSGLPLFAVLSVNVVAANVNDLLQNNAQVCHAISIATAAGVSPLQVIQARQAGGGHGWGQIAKQFNVHPSVLGNQSCSETQIADTVEAAGGNGKGKGKGKGKGHS